VLGGGLLLLAFSGRVAPGDDKPEEKAKTPEVKQIDITKLPNDELLKRSDAIATKSSGDYRAALRSLAGLEAQLADVTRLLSELTAPKSAPTPGGNAEEAAKAAVNVAKAKVAYAQQKSKFTQARKLLHERILAASDDIQSAAASYFAALDELKPVSIEIDLRLRDGTLNGANTRELVPDAIAKTRQELSAEQETFKGKLSDYRKAAETAAKQAEEADKELVAAEAESLEASRVYVREQNRKELEKKYTGKSADNMLAELEKLVHDGQGLKGTYELGFQRFNNQASAAATLRKELEALKLPEVTMPQITRAEDVEPAIKATEALIQYHTARVAKIEALSKALEALAKQGGVFEGDATVSDDHLFKMQVLSGLIAKAGDVKKLPDQASPKRLEEAVTRAKKLASEVRAGTEKAKTEFAQLEKDLTEAKAARTAVNQQLANLKQSQDAILFALRFQEQLVKMNSKDLLEQFQKLRASLTEQMANLKTGADEYKKATTAVTEARTKLDALKDPLLREAEEQGQAEKQKILTQLRKESGLDRTMAGSPMMGMMGTGSPMMGTGSPMMMMGTTEAKKTDDKKPEGKEQKPEAPPLSPLEQLNVRLTGIQQQLAARSRVLDERTEKTAALLAALDALADRAAKHSRNLNQTRQTALQLNAAAVEIKTRVGRGELEGMQIPEGITEALATNGRKQLDADAGAVIEVALQVQQDRDALKKPDPEAESLKALTKELLTYAGRRIDLLGELKKLAAEYKITRRDRADSEQKRLDQIAAERIDNDRGSWDWLLALDKSRTATNLSELIETYYREIVDIEDKEDNLKKQKAKINELLDLTSKERAAIQKGVPLIEKEIGLLEILREEESVLARAAIKPEAADELLKAYQARSGKMLAKPAPVGDKDRAARIEELSNKVFERAIELEAFKKWQDILATRLAPPGLTAEAGVYQDELAQMNATSGANARRVQVLTGNPPPEEGSKPDAELQTQLPITGGEIGKNRKELNTVRRHGIQTIGIKLAIIIVLALLLPRIILFVLKRALGLGKNDSAGNSSMVLTAIGAFLKVLIWVIAIAFILSTLGFDITAILAGLGIGGLAIGLAAQPMISDVIAAVVIFVERRFAIGDVVKLGSDEPARVIGLTWRSTAFRNTDGLIVCIPNRKVTETTLVNMTRAGQTYDSLTVSVSTEKDVTMVLEVIKKAIQDCENLSQDHGISVKKYQHKGNTRVVEYRFWWFLKDYESRNKTRDEVFTRIGAELARENMTGTEVTLS
jgi:small-conductance mechanosensitive channel